MKPVSIRFKCFGPYIDEQYINFKELSERGIFLISGETGSGKTTILDAICYALFGKSSGGLRGDIEVMRCKSAPLTESTFVEYIFESGGNTYKFHRELKYGRKNMSEYDGCEILRNGNFEPLFENPKKTAINKKAEDIIGLTYDQFCQVVILPQGKFEKLLVSNSEDKEKILTSLFHADKWGKIVSMIKEKVESENKRLDFEYNDIKSKLDLYGCETLEALKINNEAISAEIETLSTNLDAIEKKKICSSKIYEEAIKHNEIYATLESYKTRLDRLQSQANDFEIKKKELNLSEKADSMREAYNLFHSISNICKSSGEEFIKAKSSLDKIKNEKEKIAEAKKNHRNKKDVYEDDKLQLSRLNDSIKLYSEIEEKRKHLATIFNTYKKKDMETERLKKDWENASKLWEVARIANNDAVSEYTRISTMYTANIASILARELAPNAPCPVCGSKIHPSLAKTSEDCNISKDDVDSANEKINSTSQKLSEEKERQKLAESYYNKANEDLQKTKEEYDNENAEYRAMSNRLIVGIDDYKTLSKEIRKIKTLIADYEKQDEEITFRLDDVNKRASAAEQHFIDLQKKNEENIQKLELERENFRKLLAKNSFANDDEFLAVLVDKEIIKRKSLEISEYESEKKSARDGYEAQLKKVNEIKKPDMQKLKAEKERSEVEFTEKKSELSRIKSDFIARERLYNELKKRYTKYQSERIEADSNTDFVRKLNPSTGMSLQRYVLGIMLSSITATANELLKNVHGGKYQLLRSYEASGNKRKVGLELDILDTGTNEKRSVTTLSGGEKFLVALCLAIGLSTVVQAQSGGTRLEAMFIDEGFGSLDDGSIDDALDVLEGIQKSHGLVGIISHIDKLSETIPTRLDIIKGVNGNKIKLVI